MSQTRALLYSLFASCCLVQPGAAQETSPKELGEVTVRAARDPDLQAQQESTSTKIIYGRDKLDKTADSTVAEFIKRLPGVTVSGTPGAGGSVRMLGLGRGATQILIDGERIVGNAQNRQQQLDRIPLDLVERIEVIPTPTAETGGRGTAGTINIVLREARGNEETSIRVGVGANSGEEATRYPFTTNLVTGDKIGNLKWLLAGSINERRPLSSVQRDTQVFDSAQTRSAWDVSLDDNRNRVREFNLNPRLNWQLNTTDSFGLFPNLSRVEEDINRRTSLFTYSAPASGTGFTPNGVETLRGDSVQDALRVFGIWKRKFNKSDELSLRAYVQNSQQELNTRRLAFNSAGTLTTTTLENSTRDDREILLGLRYKATLNPQHQISTGGEASVRKRNDQRRVIVNGVVSNSALGDTLDLTETRSALYLQDEWSFATSQVITPGLRIEYLGIDDRSATGRDSSDVFLSPSLHYLWRVDPATSVRASVTRTQRIPGFDERSPLVTTNTGTLTNSDVGGNPNLKTQTAIGYELRFEHQLPQQIGVLSANFSLRELTDTIETRIQAENSRFVQRPDNVGDARVLGLVLDARSRMDVIGLPNLTLRTNHSWFDSRVQDPNTSTTRSLNDQPKRVLNFGFDYRHKPWGLEFGASYNRIGAFLKQSSSNERESAVTVVDVYVARKLDRHFTLRFTAGNALRGERSNDSRFFDSGTGNTTQVASTEKGALNALLMLEGKW